MVISRKSSPKLTLVPRVSVGGRGERDPGNEGSTQSSLEYSVVHFRKVVKTKSYDPRSAAFTAS